MNDNYTQYCKAKAEIDEEPLTEAQWRQMLVDLEVSEE